MKKLLRTAKCVMLAMGMVGIAHAGSSNWTGFYAGANAGFGFNDAHLTSQHLGFTLPSETCDMSLDFSTFFPGLQVGYLHQFANTLVSGLEANATFNSHQQHTSSCNSEFNPNVYDGFTFRNQMQTSLKGRLGLALDWNKNTFLPYLIVGASFANLGLTYKNEGGDYYSTTSTQPGWLIGAGLEWAFMQHWSVRAEYYYTDYGNAIRLNIPTVYRLLDTNGKGQVNLRSNNFAVAVNYWI